MHPHYTVRRLLVDLAMPLPRHWAGGDAFKTAFFNALSMSFPAGEQFFIDAVRAGAAALPEPTRAEFESEVRGFVGQEATHRRLHALFNAQLERQGLVNAWEPRIFVRQRRIAGLDPRHAVAVTAAYEHFTAILAEYLLARPQTLAEAEPRLADFWSWHAAEESEHRATAFDLYRALGGDEVHRRRWMTIATLNFTTDVLRQTVLNLRRDGTLWKASTWRSGWHLWFGADGLVRRLFSPWLRYYAASFHPREHGGSAGPAWLEAHADRWRAVGNG